MPSPGGIPVAGIETPHAGQEPRIVPVPIAGEDCVDDAAPPLEPATPTKEPEAIVPVGKIKRELHDPSARVRSASPIGRRQDAA